MNAPSIQSSVRITINQWTTALRSGEYEQAQQMLHTNTGYCCLGVVCEVARKLAPDQFNWNEDFDNTFTLANPVAAELFEEHHGTLPDRSFYSSDLNSFMEEEYGASNTELPEFFIPLIQIPDGKPALSPAGTFDPMLLPIPLRARASRFYEEEATVTRRPITGLVSPSTRGISFEQYLAEPHNWADYRLERSYSLVALNDNGADFNLIADVIDAVWGS